MVDKTKAARAEDVRLLNVQDAARYLGTTVKTLYGRVWRREISFVKLGRSVRFDIEDLRRLVEEAKVKPQGPGPVWRRSGGDNDGRTAPR
jgi:excisionase family DNA binding protein